MKLIWEPEKEDVAKVKALCDAFAQNKRVSPPHTFGLSVDTSNENFWTCTVVGILEASKYSIYTNRMVESMQPTLEKLTLPLMYLYHGRYLYIRAVLKKDSKVRHVTELTEEIAGVFSALDACKWQVWQDYKVRLTENHNRELEKEVIQALTSLLSISPFLCRRVLHSIGVIKYEIPVYQKHLHWLNSFNLPFQFLLSKLKYENYYTLVSDFINTLSDTAGVSPYELNAAVLTCYSHKTCVRRRPRFPIMCLVLK